MRRARAGMGNASVQVPLAKAKKRDRRFPGGLPIFSMQRKPNGSRNGSDFVVGSVFGRVLGLVGHVGGIFGHVGGVFSRVGSFIGPFVRSSGRGVGGSAEIGRASCRERW